MDEIVRAVEREFLKKRTEEEEFTPATSCGCTSGSPKGRRSGSRCSRGSCSRRAEPERGR